MPNSVIENVDDLNAVLTVSIPKEDYMPSVKSKLNDYRRKASLKGFRAGKAPMSFIRKMYGTGVLSEVINDKLQSTISKFFADNEDLDILGQPIPSDDSETYDFELKTAEDFEFKFDLGIAPKFELQGFSDANTIEKYKVTVDDEIIDKEIERERKRLGESLEGEVVELENDLLKLELHELDGDDVKEGGLTVETYLSLDMAGTDELRETLMGKKLEEELVININELEKDRTPEDVRKYILGVGEEQAYNEQFKAKIVEIKRQVLADVNTDFFEKMFPNQNIETEEAFRTKIADDMANFYDGQADNLFFSKFQQVLIESNPLPLPENFLKRWMDMTNEDKTMADVEAEFDSFRESLLWKLIVNKITDEHNIKVEAEDIEESFAKEIRGYFGGSVDDEYIKSMIKNFMQDRNAVERKVDALITEKIIEVAKENYTIEEKEINTTDFVELIKSFNEKIAAKKEAATTTEEVVEETTSDDNTEEA